MKQHCLAISLFSLLSPTFAHATNEEACVLALYQTGDRSLTLEEMRKQCQPKTLNSKDKTLEVSEPSLTKVAKAPNKKGKLTKRIEEEKKSAFEPYVITPHRMNYVMPVLTSSGMNPDAYKLVPGYNENFEDLETKFQLSIKLPLNTRDLFIEGDALYFAFTIEAWWQIYSHNISKPFRETNYQPEFFYGLPLDWQPFGGNTLLLVGVEHQSNGKSQLLSRSWNRAYLNFLWEKDDFALSLRPWYRFKEKEKEFILDPDGDDNPDILDYMGHYELAMSYQWNTLAFGFIGRYNFATHNGSGELGVTFPIYGKLKGYANVFTGYGESLIDYNHNQTRVGLGFTVNDLF
ncbi:phospholipase A [Thalassotalea sp. LPB0316]|uniref:phospholipase A n=1 Tax=Thalassotalea sp. LPB0316 TaxID=2769490 RepID=UPI001865D6DA|nr:phospholipase A [Thalassotalea sp. LPB0316]QOL26705.1 phospholipase A [Thalassotalea sp. LPB0316]